jgi:propanediol dehydratase small subunit
MSDWTIREAAAAYAAAAVEGEKATRKNYYLHQSKIDLVKAIVGASSETEAVEAALDALIYGEALAVGTEAMGGEEYHDVLGLGSEIPKRADPK